MNHLITKNTAIFSLLLVFGFPIFVSSEALARYYRCKCEMEFERRGDHSRYPVQVEVMCPVDASYTEIFCDGEESFGRLRTNCQNTTTGETKYEESLKQWEADPRSPWPNCYIF